MNTQLVKSIIQVVRALPTDEQTFLIQILNQLFQQPSTGPTTSQQAKINPTHQTESATAADDPWQIWQSLGDDAVPGTLDNTSTRHDHYLYSDSQ